MSKFREQMQKAGVCMRAIASVTGVSSSLVCYIAQGYAHFPSYEQLQEACTYMECEPTDVYTKVELRTMYPEQFPKRKRGKDGNPRVRISREAYEYIDVYAKACNKPTGKLINGLITGAVKQDMRIAEGIRAMNGGEQ